MEPGGLGTEGKSIMWTRKSRDLTVSEVDMGCMAFSHGYGKISPEKYNIEANTYQHGYAFFDTAEVNSQNLAGVGHNERIAWKTLCVMWRNVVLATKLFLDKTEIGKVSSVYAIFRECGGNI